MHDENSSIGLFDRLSHARDALRELTARDQHDVVVVLGSGFGQYTDTLHDAIAVSFADLPGFPELSAASHAGTAYSLAVGDKNVLVYAGRAHAYEGHSMDAVTFAVRTAVFSGCSRVILTNAAGGCTDEIEPGHLVIVSDHINGAGMNPLAGPNDERIGPRWPDMTEVYTPALREQARTAALAAGATVHEGVYYWWQGPMFETPAEIRMAQMLGCSLAGMSTVPEAVAARHMGADVLAVSLCTNKAAGMTGQLVTTQEVFDTAAASAPILTKFLDLMIGRQEATIVSSSDER